MARVPRDRGARPRERQPAPPVHRLYRPQHPPAGIARPHSGPRGGRKVLSEGLFPDADEDRFSAILFTNYSWHWDGARPAGNPIQVVVRSARTAIPVPIKQLDPVAEAVFQYGERPELAGTAFGRCGGSTAATARIESAGEYGGSSFACRLGWARGGDSLSIVRGQRRGMRWARATLLGAAVTCGLALGVTTAQAAAAPCSAANPKAVQIVPPAEILFGRQTEIPVTAEDAIYTGEWGLSGGAWGGEVQFTASSADPAAPISHPFAQTVVPTVHGYEYYDIDELPTLLLELGDGPAQLSATWEQYQQGDSYQSCTATTSVVVSGVSGGDPPRRVKAIADLEYSIDRRRSPRYFTWWEEWVEFEVTPAKPAHAAISALTVQVKGAGDVRTMSLADQGDERWTSRRWGAKRWHLAPSGRFIPNPNLRETERFRFVMRFGGQVINRGSFRVDYERAFSERIWEGSDAFINVCINSTRRLFSRHHRLYCWDYRYPAVQAIEGLQQS